MLEVDQDGILELQREFHVGRVPEDVVAVEVEDDELELLERELLPNACPGSNTKGNECIGMPSLAFLALRVKPLRPKHVGVWELLWVFC